MAPNSMAKRWLLLGASFWALFTILAFLSSLGDVSSGAAHQPMPWGPVLRQQFKHWYAAGVLAMAVVWFCGHNRLEQGKGKRWVLVHLATACLFSAIYMLGTAWLVAGEPSVLHPGQILTFSFLIKRVGGEFFALSLVVYWMTVFGHLIWDYYHRLRERELQTAQLQRELVEARLDALRMQLNPHFLFNTLHAISALIHEQPEAADRMVARLSELLRLSLDPSKPQEVPLSEEMAFLEGYLEIEQTRFSERLQVTKQIEAGTETALVPFLLLQPLVENAIRHGIEPREERGCLAITARRRNGKLELRVRDDGPGLAQKGASGIGLSNTRSRLQHLYGEQFSFELHDLAEGGLEALISLPFRTNAKAS
jgi:two-component system, LytTR family, sensor kinase